MFDHKEKDMNILVVDDEPEILDLLKEILSKRGYRVLSALNGKDAIVLYEQHRPPVKIGRAHV